MNIRVGKVHYKSSEQPAETHVYKQQQKRKIPPLLGSFESVELPKTGYIPLADSQSLNSMAGRK